MIGTEGCSTPVGIAGRLRPRRSDSDEEAQLTPHGKEHHGVEINISLISNNILRKQLFYKSEL